MLDNETCFCFCQLVILHQMQNEPGASDLTSDAA